MQGAAQVGDTLELPEQRVQKKVRSMQMFRRPVQSCLQVRPACRNSLGLSTPVPGWLFVFTYMHSAFGARSACGREACCAALAQPSND